LSSTEKSLLSKVKGMNRFWEGIGEMEGCMEKLSCISNNCVDGQALVGQHELVGAIGTNQIHFMRIRQGCRHLGKCMCHGRHLRWQSY
jgi:hypothetical protein